LPLLLLLLLLLLPASVFAVRYRCCCPFLVPLITSRDGFSMLLSLPTVWYPS
jgi:hypothetical protein